MHFKKPETKFDEVNLHLNSRGERRALSKAMERWSDGAFIIKTKDKSKKTKVNSV